MARTAGQAKRGVIARIKWNKARELSRQGVSYDEAARSLGMTASGLNSLLYRNTRATLWPIVEDE